MRMSFAFCASRPRPYVEMYRSSDGSRVWCCLGSNIHLDDPAASHAPLQGSSDLNDLAVSLASDERFRALVGDDTAAMNGPIHAYYIR